MVLNIVMWIVLGALAGWIASKIMKTDAQMGALANIAVGIIGAFIGGFIIENVFNTNVSGFNFMSLLVAILGSVILLAIVKAVTGRRAHHVQ